MSEKAEERLWIKLSTKILVNNQKKVNETYDACIARVFETYADYKKEGFVQ